MRHHTIYHFRFAPVHSGAVGKAGGGASSNGSPSATKESSVADDALAAVIAERLAAAEDSEIDRVHVAVQRACVTLRGEVPSRRSMSRIEALVGSCEGVSRIDNQMRVGYSH